MKAAVFDGSHELKIIERDIPEPDKQEILIRVVACGVCHTDEGYIEGTPTFKKPPLILGHEASGYVEKVGDDVRHLKSGDPVLIPPVLTCGKCKYCISGRSEICSKQLMLGNHIDGAFAEYVCVDAKDIVKIPEGMEVKDLAIVADAVASPYHAVVNRAQVKEMDLIAVIGCGGLGVNVIQFCKLQGATVIGVDIQDEKLEMARNYGADHVVNTKGMDRPDKEIKKILGSLDIVFEVIGNPNTQKLGFDLLGAGGKLIVVGYSPKKWDGFFSGKVMFRELALIGSLGCPPEDFPKILELINEGKIRISNQITHRYPLDRINEAFDALRSGKSLRVLVEIS